MLAEVRVSGVTQEVNQEVCRENSYYEVSGDAFSEENGARLLWLIFLRQIENENFSVIIIIINIFT